MITEADLYCMGMESDTAYKHMEQLCWLLGYPFPPRLPAADTTKRDAMPDPFKEYANECA